jgi:hypothetical protein
VGWLSVLRSEKVRKLLDQKYLQLSLLDQQNPAEIHSPDFPGERLMACFNPLLAYNVEGHLRQVLAPLLFDDETLATDRKRRVPVVPAEPSTAAKTKKVERVTEYGLPIHSCNTLMAEMGTRCRHRC